MRNEPEISCVSVVIAGSFNPAIFSPAWFALHGILPRAAVENADPHLLHEMLASFSTEWLHLHVTPNKFQASSQQGPSVRIRDFVLRVFKEHLIHAPLKAIGINRDIHFMADSTRSRDRVGRKLAPVGPWGHIGQKLCLGADHGGMVSLTMRQSQPAGRPPGGHISVTVEPSAEIGDGRLGIYVQVNDHYLIDQAASDGREQLLGFLESDFELSINRADEIVDHVMSIAADQ